MRIAESCEAGKAVIPPTLPEEDDEGDDPADLVVLTDMEAYGAVGNADGVMITGNATDEFDGISKTCCTQFFRSHRPQFRLHSLFRAYASHTRV